MDMTPSQKAKITRQKHREAPRAKEAQRELQRQAGEAQELIERAGLWKPE